MGSGPVRTFHIRNKRPRDGRGCRPQAAEKVAAIQFELDEFHAVGGWCRSWAEKITYGDGRGSKGQGG